MESATEQMYLEGVNIIKLQSAARMAGLRWKSGDPAFNKSGIIEKLMQHPSIRRACIATLQRMGENAPSTPIDFTQDLTDDDASTPAQDTPKAIPQAQTPASAMSAAASPAVDLSPILENLRALDRRLRTNEAIDQAQEGQRKTLEENIDVLSRAVESLQEQKPIQFNFPSRQPVTIKPGNHHALFPKMIKYLETNRRLILSGPAGTGKSMACANAAETMGVSFHLLTPVTASHELIGHRDAQGVFHETPLTLAYKHGGLCLLDEADASLADAMLCANPILDGNGFAMLGDGKMHKQHPDFLAVLNMNTDGNGATMQYAGRTRLDGSTLARFGCRILWTVDPRIEAAMARGQDSWLRVVHAVRALMTQREIVDVNATPRHVKTGAMLLQANCATRKEILEDCLMNGAVSEMWQDVLSLPPVRSFLQGA
jgi:hypothetical protein